MLHYDYGYEAGRTVLVMPLSRFKPKGVIAVMMVL